MRHPLRRLGLAAAACAAFDHSLAQTAASVLESRDPEPIVVAQVQSVEVKGHYDNAVGTSDAASQGTISGERLTDLPLLRPGEVLQTIPGMVVAQHSGDGKANQYFLRGYNLDHGTDFSTSIDGVPVNMPANAHGQGYTDLNFLIPELVSKIEYRKGPYFAENGDFSSAGSAKIKYVDGLDQGLLDITAGGGGYRRLLLAGSRPLGAAPAPAGTPGQRVLGAVELETDDGPWTTPERFRKFNGLVRLSDGTAAQGWSVDGAGYASHWTSTDQVPLELIRSGQLGRYSALDPTDGGKSARAIVSGEWHQRDAAGYTSVAAYAQHYELTLWSDFTFFELRPATGDQFKQSESRNFFGGQLVHGWDHRLFGADSVTEAGLQVRHDHIDVGLYNTQARVVFKTVSNDRVGETEAGAYVQNTTNWLPWLRSLAGLRADRVDMRVDALEIPANSGRGSGNKVSPKLSLIFGPWKQTELFANAGRGFHSNDARGVIDKVDSTTGAPASAVPALVGSKGEELGLRTQYIPGLQTSLAFWRLDSDSELVYNTNSSIGSTEASGASKRHGIELNNHVVVGDWLLVDADMAWTHARYADNNVNGEEGNFIANAVSRVGLLGITLPRLGPWSAGLVTRFIGSYPLSQDGKLTTPGAIVSNLQVKRDLAPGCAVSVDVLNLFNRRFYDMAYEQDYRVSPTSPVVPGGVTVHPGELREFRVSLNFRI
ncbi:MAG: TonB-dependent receptor [Pseudomonadota bacterium]|nr:TonB-dependent receptor [Pseudomonadota bacterium]